MGAEEFTNEFISFIRGGKGGSFRKQYREMGVMLVYDTQSEATRTMIAAIARCTLGTSPEAPSGHSRRTGRPSPRTARCPSARGAVPPPAAYNLNARDWNGERPLS